MTEKYSVFAQTDAQAHITAVNSSAFLSDTAGWVKIDEGTGDKYHHAQNNYLEKPLFTWNCTYAYKLVKGKVEETTEAEQAAELAEITAAQPPTETQRLAALEAAMLAMMGGAAGV